MISLFLFVAYWTSASYNHFFGFITGSDPESVAYVNYLGIVFWVGHIGLTARIIGVALGILSLMLFIFRIIPSARIRKFVSLALILESVYFISYIPNTPYLWRSGFSGAFYLGLGYFIQFLLVSPVLAVLAYKTIKYEQSLKDHSFWKWAGLAFIVYVSALWVNSMVRWFDMGIISIEFVNSALFMSLAIVFSISAAYYLNKLETRAIKWMGLAFIMIGLHYTIYLINLYSLGMLNFALLADIWTIPLLFLGISLVIGKADYFLDEGL